MITLTQGDSYEQDFESPDIPKFDGDWGGRWSLVPKLGALPLAFGVLGISADKKLIMLRITPEESTLFPTGKHLLIVQVDNEVLGFRKELVRDTIDIQIQGIK